MSQECWDHTKVKREAMGFVPWKRKRPQQLKTNFPWASTKGGRNSPWRAQKKGAAEGMEGD